MVWGMLFTWYRNSCYFHQFWIEDGGPDETQSDGDIERPANIEGYGEEREEIDENLPFKDFETVYKDGIFQLQVRREKFLEPKNFSIHDIKFEIKATHIKSSDKTLVVSTLGAITHGVQAVVKKLKSYYGKGDHEILIVFHHDDIFNRGVRVGR